MTKTTRIVCLCILGAVGMLCGVSTINKPLFYSGYKNVTRAKREANSAEKIRSHQVGLQKCNPGEKGKSCKIGRK